MRAIIFLLALVLSSCNWKTAYKSKNYEISRDSSTFSGVSSSSTTDSTISASGFSSEEVEVEYVFNEPEKFEILGNVSEISSIRIRKRSEEGTDTTVTISSGSATYKTIECSVIESEEKSTTKTEESKKTDYKLYIFAIVFIVAVCFFSFSYLRPH